MGGQVADRGVVLNSAEEVVAEVVDVQKAPNGQHLHTLDVKAPLSVNEHYHLAVDAPYHTAVSKNHTATHMLDQAIRNILGNRSTQAGSLVTADNLRYDFSYNEAVPAEKLQEIEDLINAKIIENLPVSWIETDKETAEKMGAVAEFSENMEIRFELFQLAISTPNLTVVHTLTQRLNWESLRLSASKVLVRAFAVLRPSLVKVQ
ncbi:Alanine--tRNA ligase [Weissella viridescens]|uniref:alanine--tRNA ligase n=1 Tax=Weissella viridescens TaxID=1629 RepID=A0A380P0M1_WEIVI|nr:Alanine--tRNA ligase [Weissella viridescens]